MNNVVAILKRRWPILAMLILVAAAVPTMIYFSGKMRTDLRDRVAREVQADLAEIVSGGSTVKVNYTVPAVGPRAEIAFKGPPNEVLVARFKDWRDRQVDELGKVIDSAMTFNRGKRNLLVEGLFPAPSAADEAIKPREFQRAYLSLEGEQSAHAALIRRYGGGPPIDALEFAQEMKDRQADEVRKITSSEKSEFNQLPADLQARVTKTMLEYRLKRYRDKASTLSFYCEPAAFNLPSLSNEAPSVTQCWWWQWEYWIREDVLAAAQAANRPTADSGIIGSVVKRIVSMTVEPHQLIAVDPNNPVTAAFPLGSDAPAPHKPEHSLTGRTSDVNAGNNYYVVRKAVVELVAAPSRLPQFIDALAARNFITVLDCDLDKFDTNDHLKAGYYYGEEPVVAVRLQLESLWLREWLLPILPKDAREQLGIPAPPEPPPAEGADAAPADAPPPPPPPPPPPGR